MGARRSALSQRRNCPRERWYCASEFGTTLASSKEVKETVRKGQKLPAEVSTRVFVYLSQAEYQGDWLGGLRHGQGEIRYADGSVYAGGWSYGYPSGLGTFTHADGEQYIGRWTNPFPEVHQSLRVLGREAVAKWKNGLPNGYGTSLGRVARLQGEPILPHRAAPDPGTGQDAADRGEAEQTEGNAGSHQSD